VAIQRFRLNFLSEYSTISSASSRTRNLVSLRFIALRWIKSIKRPGGHYVFGEAIVPFVV
jgi:hypothetical protein